MKQAYYYIEGFFRIAFTILVSIVGYVISLIFAFIPIEVKGAPLIMWVPVTLSKLFVWLFDITIMSDSKKEIAQHPGIIIANHTSYLDIMILNSIVPLRFLSMAAVRKIPVIGFLAAKSGTVFVDRENRGERHRALVAIEDALVDRKFPPMAIFPEGKVGKGDKILPFKRGAFVASKTSSAKILALTIGFSDLGRVEWGDRSYLSSLWYIATSEEDLTIQLEKVEVDQEEIDASEDGGMKLYEEEMQRTLNSIHGSNTVLTI